MKLLKKICVAFVSQMMLFGTMGIMPIQANWPDEGYVHEPSEDKDFSSCEEAMDFASNHGWDMYYKYGNKKNEYAVYDNGNGTWKLCWYIYNPGAPTPTPTPSPTPTPTPSPKSQDEIDFTVGYTYQPSEDKVFASCDEACQYGQDEGWNMYHKYSRPVKFYVVNEGGQYVIHWYTKA